MKIVPIDTRSIDSEGSFHKIFKEAFGFPAFYGGNMNAWIDCMTSLDEPSDGMTRIHADPGGVITLRLDHVEDFRARCPQIYSTLIECAAFVNWRRVDNGESPVLALAFWK